jgi:hypothetical protein
VTIKIAARGDPAHRIPAQRIAAEKSPLVTASA